MEIKHGSSSWLIIIMAGSVHDVEYADGLVYSVFRGPSAIGALNVAMKDWTIIPYPEKAQKFWTLPDDLLNMTENF